MYEIEMQRASAEFEDIWLAAGKHLEKQVQGALFWLRADLSPPFLEHLSFRLGNQLFFVRVQDADGRVDVPGEMKGLLFVAEGCAGHPCIMSMRKGTLGGWKPENPGWGLVDAITGELVDPFILVSDKQIEMTDWELYDLAVQVVRNHLESLNRRITSWTGTPEVDPAIWFVGESEKPEWVVVRVARYPKAKPSQPANWNDIAEYASQLSDVGHFASVVLAGTDDTAHNGREKLWRGHEVSLAFFGFDAVQQ